MLQWFKRGQGSIVLRIKLRDSSVTTGAGKTGLTSSSSGLIISTIADNEATATAYTQAGSTIESITTLGTYAAPTATKCRFKEVDATNHKGVYEIQIADARYAVSNAKSLLISISGVTGLAECDAVIPLTDMDPYDAVRAGLTALPNVASGAAGAIITSGTGTAQLSTSSGQVLLQTGTGAGQLDFTSGVVKANATQFAGQTITCAGGVTIPAATLASTTNITAGTITTVTTVTNQLTAAQIATGVWQDATGGDFTTANSIGKSLYNAFTSNTSVFTTASLVNAPTGGSAPTAAAVATAVWTDLLAGSDFSTSVSIGKLIKDYLDTSISSRMASYTQPTGFLAATFPTGTVANTTNITAGTITTTTNLTNLPTAPTDWITAAALKTDAVQEIVNGVWDEAISGHLTGGSTGASLNAAGGSGDPWSTSLPGAYVAGTAGYLIGTYLNATITSRMATYTQPTGFLAASFPSGTIANTTNITAGTITTATNLTNLPTAPTDWITAASVKADAVTKIQAGLSTYAGGDTSGVTTLLSRLSSGRATNLDNLDATVSSRLATIGYTAPPSAGTIVSGIFSEVVGYGTLTFAEHVIILGAVAAGITSGWSTGTPVFRDLDDTKDVVTGVLNINLDRTSVILTP